MDFSEAEAREATQVLDTVETREGVEYQVKYALPLPTQMKLTSRAAKFAGMTSLTVYIPSNSSEGDEETTRVYYIGLRGKHSPVSWADIVQIRKSG